MGAHESFVLQAEFKDVLESAVQKRRVAAGVDREILIDKLRAEQRRFHHRRNPVLLHARFTIGVDRNDLGAGFFRVIHVFRGDWLIIRRVGADENEDVGPDPVAIRAGGRADAEHLLQRDRTWRMADARGVVDVVGSDRADRFLGGVIGFVRACRGWSGKRRRGPVAVALIFAAISSSAASQLTRVKPGSPLRRIIG